MDKKGSNGGEKTKKQSVDPLEEAKTCSLPHTHFKYTEKDAILYALGVGVECGENNTKFLYERDENFTTLPTFGVIPMMEHVIKVMDDGLPGFPFDAAKILHGEQYIQLLKPLPPTGCFKSQVRVADIVDKKSGALIILNIDTFDQNGEKMIFNQIVLFAVGYGGFNGPNTSNELIPFVEVPNRNPDASRTEKTRNNQAALYRLSGDTNAIHIDPKFAATAGFQSPLLHGLCSFGFSARHVMASFANNDMNLFKDAKVRFLKPVIPGQTLHTDMWREGHRIHFQTKLDQERKNRYKKLSNYRT